MIDLSYYIKVSSSPSGCDSYNAKKFKCDRYLDCESCLEDKIIEHDKHIIEQYKADTNLKDTIREIHDNVAHEMYCKVIDDFLSEICKMIVQSESNGNYRFYACEIKQSIADLAEELKAGGKE